jgi:hypothetical protein
LVKGSASFKEGEEAKASPNGSNWLNKKIKDLEKEAICYFTVAEKCVTRNLWASHVWQHLKKLGISISLQSIYKRGNGCFENFRHN